MALFQYPISNTSTVGYGTIIFELAKYLIVICIVGTVGR